MILMLYGCDNVCAFYRLKYTNLKMLILIAFIPLLFTLYLIKKFFGNKAKSIHNKHVVITGGSSGIGKCVAILAAMQGAHVTIIARNKKKLGEAVKEIVDVTISDTQKIHSVSLDVSNYEEVSRTLQEIDENPIFMLVNCAGLAVCGKIEDLDITDIKKMIDINYYGTYFPIKTIISKMKQRKEGIIVITGSQASLFGIFGYSAYASSKFALRGLAEALDMEVRPYNISVTLSLPPDTDTPGFENENKSKPKETRLISQSAGVFKPEQVAEKIISDALNGNFFSNIGFESYLLTTLCVGMTPFPSLFDLINQSLLLGPFKLISSYYLSSFHSIIKKCAGSNVNGR